MSWTRDNDWMTEEAEILLDSLTPADIGMDTAGEITIRFEGFSDECWESAYEDRKTVDDLAEEIVLDWSKRPGTKDLVLLESGWWTPDIFCAVYRSPLLYS